MVETAHVAHYRITTPDGRVVSSWIVTPIVDRPWAPVMTPHISLGGDCFMPPWRVERRSGDEDWQLIDDSDAAAKRWATLKP